MITSKVRIAILSVSAVITMGLCGTQAQAKDIKWVKTFGEAISMAKKTDKLIMVDFYTDWCSWCKRLDSDTYPSKEVGKAANQFISLKLNAEKDGIAEAKKYRVTGFPSILFINGSGEVESKIDGYMPAAPFAQKMTQIATAHKELPILEATVASKPGDTNSSLKLANIYADRGRVDKAIKLVGLAERSNPADKSGVIAKSNNHIADFYGEHGKFAEALPYFLKATRTAREPREKALANIGTAACLFNTGKGKDAKPFIATVLKMPDAPAEMKQMAQQMQQSAAKFK